MVDNEIVKVILSDENRREKTVEALKKLVDNLEENHKLVHCYVVPELSRRNKDANKIITTYETFQIITRQLITYTLNNLYSEIDCNLPTILIKEEN